MIRFVLGWAATLVFVGVIGVEAAPSQTTVIKDAFYTFIRRGDSVEITAHQRTVDLEFRRDPSSLTIDLQALKLTDLTPSAMKVSPKGRWLAVSMGSRDWERALIILDTQSRQIVFVMREPEFEGIWFEWKDESRVHFLREVDTPMGTPEKFHVYSIHAPRWTGTEKRITRNPTKSPWFLEDGYRSRERRAKHAQKALLPLGYFPPLSAPLPGTEGFPAPPWLPHLMDHDGRFGSVSPSEREMALVVGRDTGENAVILLRKRKGQWWESTLRTIKPNEDVWLTRFWGEYVVVGIDNWKLVQAKSNLPGHIEYSNRRFALYSLGTGAVISEVQGEAFAPTRSHTKGFPSPPILPGERLIKPRDPIREL